MSAAAQVDRLLAVAEVAELLGVSKATVWKMGRQGELPKSVQLGERMTRWRSSDIQKFMEEKKSS